MSVNKYTGVNVLYDRLTTDDLIKGIINWMKDYNKSHLENLDLQYDLDGKAKNLIKDLDLSMKAFRSHTERKDFKELAERQGLKITAGKKSGLVNLELCDSETIQKEKEERLRFIAIMIKRAVNKHKNLRINILKCDEVEIKSNLVKQQEYIDFFDSHIELLDEVGLVCKRDLFLEEFVYISKK